MSRELKFRAWDIEESKMIYDDSEIFLGYHIDAFGAFDAEGYEFMQFTGLTDSKGKEIYEGDIVKQSLVFDYDDGYNGGPSADIDYTGKVVVLASKGVCLHKPLFRDNLDESSGRSNNYLNVRSCRAKVIGNIYTTPELLEDK